MSYNKTFLKKIIHQLYEIYLSRTFKYNLPCCLVYFSDRTYALESRVSGRDVEYPMIVMQKSDDTLYSKKKKSCTKKELSNCYKNWWVSNTNIEK